MVDFFGVFGTNFHMGLLRPTVGDLKATVAYLSVIKHDNWKSSIHDV